MNHYRINREGRKLTVEILNSVPDFEAAEIIDKLYEETVDFIEEELYGPIENDDEELDEVDESFFDDEDNYDNRREDSPERAESYSVEYGS